MKKNLSNFNDWLISESEEAERLRRLNEAFDPKDEQRIRDIVKKADKPNLLGSEKKEKEIQLATTMAKAITDPDKALRRGDAAKELDLDYLAKIFYERANELGASVDTDDLEIGKEEEDDDEVADEPKEETSDEENEKAPKKERKKREKKERPPIPEKPKKGEYYPVTAEMVLEKEVGLHDRKGGWRWITATNSGLRILNVIEPERGGRYKNAVEAKARLDIDYLNDMKSKHEVLFYVKATKTGSQWIEGDPMFYNGVEPSTQPNKIRFPRKLIQKPGTELKIILDNLYLISKNKGIVKFFIGDEDFIYNEEGKETEITPGQYVIAALNFDLTNKMNTPIAWCYPTAESERKMKHPKAFLVSLSKLDDLKNDISPEQIKVVAEYMGKQLGTEIEIDRGVFVIPYFTLNIAKGKGLKNYTASPFFSRDQAEKHYEDLKKRAANEKVPFDINAPYSIDVSSGYYSGFRLSFSQLMDYAKLAGIEVKMRKFFEDEKGAVAAKKFGF